MSEKDHSNTLYWDEPCGTTRMEQLGVSKGEEHSPTALAALDEFFFEFYPYLSRLIPFGSFRDKDVLEVGLGMGSVSYRIAQSGARFVGLDIAQGPVNLVNTRMQREGFPEAARQGSILSAPFGNGSFDHIVSLGCLHHTGDLPRALDEVHRLLRPGGSALVMLYYAYSPKRWTLWPLATARHLVATVKRPAAVVEATASERAGYDRSTTGSAPPETVFTSKKQLRAFTRQFKSVSISLENLDTDMLLWPLSPRTRRKVRPLLLAFGRTTGAATEDMYVTLRK